VSASSPVRAGLIGLGAIGHGVVRIASERHPGMIVFVGALVRDPTRHRRTDGPAVVGTVQDLIATKPEVVVEAAGHDALRAHGPSLLRAGVDLFVLSAGALADPAFAAELEAAARTGGARVRVLAGAIAGLDAIRAAAVGGIERVTHTTRKPARTLLPEAEAAALSGQRELYRGAARAGVLRFPESVNVAAAVSLAGIGLDRTELRVVADPAIERNRHEVIVEGAFGRLEIRIENVPTEENPRTGRIVAMSVVAELLDHRAPVVIG
jgi:aspartate dehydrogenase